MLQRWSVLWVITTDRQSHESNSPANQINGTGREFSDRRANGRRVVFFPFPAKKIDSIEQTFLRTNKCASVHVCVCECTCVCVCVCVCEVVLLCPVRDALIRGNVSPPKVDAWELKGY